MILVVNVCREKLHYYEFVKPIEDIVGGDFVTKHYLDLSSKDLENCSKVIICGTSLKDDEFVSDVEKFFWLKNFKKPVLGICAGFQIIGLVFGARMERKREIGYFKENFKKEFFGCVGEVEVYHLHNNCISDFGDGWEIFSEGEIVQAARVKGRKIYGVLFHPEVRNREMIRGFAKLMVEGRW